MLKKLMFTIGLFGSLVSALNPLQADPSTSTTCCQEWSFFDDTKFSLGVDWLYWKINESNLDFAAFINTPDSGQHVHANVLRPDFKYDSGYRINFDYILPGDCWDVGITYTNVPGRGKRSATTDDNSDFRIQLLDDSAGIAGSNMMNLPQVSDVRNKWDVNLSYLDLDIARTVCLCESFTFRPHMGARFYWMDQKYRVSGPVVETESQAPGEFSSRFKERFNGFGIEGGIWGDWQVGCGLSVVGHLGGSVLYSKFRICGFISAPEFTDESDITETTIALSDNFWTGTPTFDYFLGLRYSNMMCDMNVSIHLGWEQQILFDVNQINRGGNLSASGLTLGANVLF